MSSYAEKLKDPRWQRKRLRIFERDNFKCRDCESDKKTLTVHHCFYERGDPWDTADEFLLTVCNPCHKIRQATEDEARRLLGILFAIGTPDTGAYFGKKFIEVSSFLRSGRRSCVKVTDGGKFL